MRRKIEWYQEVLALEPGSKVFFPLSKLFVEFGQIEDAVMTLRQGLDRHPDFMEARLLLVQLLSRQEQWDEAYEQLQAIIKPLERYPAFWSLWAQRSSGSDSDFSVFLMLVASHFTDKPVKWTEVVIEGLHSLSERLMGPLKSRVSKPKEHLPSVAPLPFGADRPRGDGAEPHASSHLDASSLRTRTMADVLAAQGDFIGALGIYRELWGRTDAGVLKDDLAGRVRTMENKLSESTSSVALDAQHSEDPFGKHAKNRLMSTLEALAARLEARVQA